MVIVFRLCFLYGILHQSFIDVVFGSVSSNSSCDQALSIPTVKTPCVPLQYNSYCSKKGVLLDDFVFVTSNTQMENNNKLNQFHKKLGNLKSLGVSLSGKCEKAINIVSCHHYFPRCDGTGDSYKAQRLCKETCQYYTNACSQELEMLKFLPGSGSYVDIINCTKLSSRNAGETPECYYFDERNDEKNCFDETGHRYQGNISVTLSGIPCQSWTAQCPHRHTMVSTYPELKNASDYCRNPRGSGKRPWCFTSDKNMRWEYCDIPSCLYAVTPIVVPTKTMITGKTVFTTTTTNSATLPTKIIPTTNAIKSVCSPADSLPVIKPPCTRLNESSAAYCKTHGVKLDSYVFRNSDDQYRAAITLNRLRDAVEIVSPVYKTFKGSECFNIIVTVFCHHYFPACDRTGRKTMEQKLCKATSDYFKETCKKDIAVAKSLGVAETINFVRTTFPTREAGKSPECWYYDGKHNETDSSKNFKSGISLEDCLYLNGRGYQGNISVTLSGIPCQSWATQCPHRHTMVSTYPELTNASNYCRNPRDSGQRPWCFTSDKNKRWEYCDNPMNCLPINGGLSNWTLNKGCNSTCGQGIEEWRRNCDAPAPRYGGKNCSLFGNSTKIRNCSNLPPCPINGNYGKWIKNSTCNVTCGDGFETWIRKCNNPTPAYSGHNCSELGKDEKLKPCVTLCPNPHSGINDWKIGISAGVTPVFLVILVILVVFGYQRTKRKYEPYATLHFDKIISMKPMENSVDCTEPDIASVHPQTYANLNEDGEPLPGVCRGIISYQQPYINVTSLNRPHYAKLQLFSSITLDWLRNAWGQVDELGKHVYDALFRGMELLLPYDKLKKPKRDSPSNRLGAIDENGDEVYDKFDRHPAVLMPINCFGVSSCVEMDEMKAEDKSLNGESIALQVLN